MVHASVEKDTLELIVQFHHAQIIVFPEVNALTTLVFALLDGLILIVPLKFVQIVAVIMDIVIMELVFVTPFSPD